MKQLFLSPRSGETAYVNFKSTLADGVPIQKIRKFLSPEDLKILGNQETLYVWGCQPSLKSRWEQMVVDDYVLFYAKGKFITASQVQLTKFDPNLALKLWPKSPKTGKPWSGLYFVKNLRKTELPLKRFNEVASYKMRALMGFQRVAGKHLESIIIRYGSIEKFIDSITIGLKDFQTAELQKIASKKTTSVNSEDLDNLDKIVSDRELDEVLEEFATRNQDKTPEERRVYQVRIKRDYKLIKTLKEKHNYRCQICNFTFKTSSGNSYCEAAHIDPISSRKKGVDAPKNILILCPNHHKMLDYGAIRVISKTEVEIKGKKSKLAH